MRVSVRARPAVQSLVENAKGAALGKKQGAMRQMRLGALPTLRS